MRKSFAVLATLLATVLSAPGPSRAAPPDAGADPVPRVHPSLRGLDSERTVPVYVVLRGAPALEAAAASRGTATALGAQAVEARVQAISRQQAAVRPRLEALGARIIYTYQRLANALQVNVPAGRLAEIAALPDVLRIDPVGIYHADNATSVPFIGAPQVWQRGPGLGDGAGVRIAIIDTGIDYTHADFGGPGTAAAYSANNPAVIEPGSFPTAKVADGYDFAGDNYDASTASKSTPHPDPDPLDCADNGHGTHVAGTAAGYGVTKAGATYTRPYNSSLDFSQFTVGPGVAPKAALVALKVFGCSGTTGLVGNALEWVADPIHHVDVVNLSLGCDFSCGSPSELEMVNNLAAAGTFVATAAGNAGNTFFITDDPGNAERAASVAATYVKGSTFRVLAPGSIAGPYDAEEGEFTKPMWQVGSLAGTLAYAQPNDACGTLTNASTMSGKVALIDRGNCTFVVKITNAQAAGAIAAVVANNADDSLVIMAGDSTGITIPGVFIGKSDGATLEQHVAEGISILLRSAVDQATSFSSRGPEWPDGRLKPDLAAPGYEIVSAGVATGNGAAVMSGTSMATPHIAGCAALVKQAHPGYSVEEIKAALMNTAVAPHDADGYPYPESRVGAGRVEVDAAVDTLVTATGDDSAGRVGLSLGVNTLTDSLSETRQVIVTNHGSSPTTVEVAVTPTLDKTGVSLVPLANQVMVPAAGSAAVPLLLTADPRLFSATGDPTTPATQGGQPRAVLSEASGKIVLTPTNGGPAIHVPYHGVFNAASNLRAGVGSICVPSGSGVQTVTIPVNGPSAHPHSLVTAFQLGATSPDRHLSDPASAAADIVAVGAATDAAAHANFSDGNIYFGIATSGPWATPQPFLVQFEVHIDTNRNGTDDYILSTQNYGTLQAGDLTDTKSATDTFVTALKKVGASGNPAFDSYVNIAPAGTLDTAPFNTNVLVMPVKISSLGLTSANATFDYYVKSYAGGDLLDTTPKATFNAARPAIDTENPVDSGLPIYLDGVPITARVDTSVVTPSNPAQVLLLYHTNVPDRRVEIVTLGGATSADLALSASSGPSVAVPGRPLTYTLTTSNAGPGAAGNTTLTDTLPAGVTLASATASQGSCSQTGDTVICALGTLASGGVATVTLTVTPPGAGTLTNVATVTSAGCDPNPANNAAVLRTTVASTVRRHLPHR